MQNVAYPYSQPCLYCNRMVMDTQSDQRASGIAILPFEVLIVRHIHDLSGLSESTVSQVQLATVSRGLKPGHISLQLRGNCDSLGGLYDTLRCGVSRRC